MVFLLMKHSELLYPNEELRENRCRDYRAQLSVKLVEFEFQEAQKMRNRA